MTNKITLFFLCFIYFLYGKEFRVITIEYTPNTGMFAAANQVLGQLYLFESGQLPHLAGLAIDFQKNGLYYDPNCGPNWWSYYFEPLCLGERKNTVTVYPTRQQYGEAWQQRSLISRETAARLVKKYIHIKPHIQQKIDAFVNEHFVNHYMIGIHYRGTDKYKEAPRVAYKTVFEEMEKYIPQKEPYSFFVATDEIGFLEEARKKYPNQIVALNVHRSSKGTQGVHLINKNNYILGEEALMDAYLLSKCHLLIKTSSNLSLWSTYFNFDLPVVLLNQRHMRTLEPE